MYIFYAVSPGLNQGPLAAATATAPGRYFPIKKIAIAGLSVNLNVYIYVLPPLFFSIL